MPDFAPLAVAGLMVNTAMAVLKTISAKQYKDAVTIVVAFVMGVLVTGLLRASDFAEGIKVGSQSLSDLNSASVVFVGFAIASIGRFVYQGIKAVDTSQSAAEPKLLPPV